MCGIYGILRWDGLERDSTILDRMGRRMIHRGPDGKGEFSDGEFRMGMQRLAIIDVKGGQQPIFNEDDSIALVCNGEIYNFRELRKELKAKGHRFRTGSDSEVIVHLYEEHGDDCVNYLNGMFTFAIWDKRRRRLVIARDRLGIKPLYIKQDPAGIVFSSELKSILELPGIKREINREALQEYLALGYVPAPHTLLKGIEKFPAATILVADRSATRSRQYWKLPEQPSFSQEPVDWAERIRDTMERSVVSQMVSDVPLGAFLSGGLDSSAVVAFMARNSSRPVRTYSIGFDSGTGGGYYNELPFARQVAEQFGTDHREIIVRPDVSRLLPELLWFMDEPVADAALITTFLVSKFARQDVTVILSGVGGDELFGGYRRYWSEYLTQLYRRLPVLLRKGAVLPMVQRLPSDRHSALFDRFRLAKGFLAGAELDSDERYESYVRVFDRDQLSDALGVADQGRSESIRRAFEQACATDPLRRTTDVDLLTQLPDDLLFLTDKMSMATSLECRVPLLDDQLVDLSLAMPSKYKVQRTQLKVGMKAALKGILPDSIIHRKKRGFGAPIGGWFKSELSSFLDQVLSEQRVRERGLVDWEFLSQLIDAHKSNREDHTDHLLALVNLEIWSQLFIDGDSHEEVTARMARAA
ncbi:MAG: asparagine synthase (glutamine-hydrolyzing) [Gammaproteobacteria bacterium]|nr:asparagine synthase (glutamine-hydrolyzing) [Gammaproteobacteria bacterium]MDH5239224.1 asparagine synthase (glutamine-hydrolyzing) [Gammaproteobacteria bacterium]MDH5259911.1 asparagine synthase (glutamine-hydrolyzing) [Gammaproteobacteria bacterium]